MNKLLIKKAEIEPLDESYVREIVKNVIEHDPDIRFDIDAESELKGIKLKGVELRGKKYKNTLFIDPETKDLNKWADEIVNNIKEDLLTIYSQEDLDNINYDKVIYDYIIEELETYCRGRD